MRIFFIDFENVSSSGLAGVSSIQPKDKVVLFYTSNASKLDFSLFEELAKVRSQTEIMQVCTGSNALDFQLSSYLGRMTAVYPDAELVIVSKDNGFNSVVSFWEGRGFKICRVNNMKMQNAQAIVKDLQGQLPDMAKDIPDIVAMIEKYKTKQGLNNALCKLYGTTKTAAINKAIKPYVKEKTGR